MAQVKVTAERTVGASAAKVSGALADYTETRPKLLTDQFSEYEVRDGGSGAGTTVHWKLQATQKRVRDCLFAVTAPEENTLVETDANSSMVTTWTVRAAGEGRSTVGIETTWNGAGGIGGFFEKTFAPLGMRKIYDAMLTKLDGVVSAQAD
ncbi:MAG: SRPBCC family protein [Sciscionella sp.]